MDVDRRALGAAVALGAAATTVASSWAPFVQVESSLWHEAESGPVIWSVWSGLAFMGPLQAAIGLSGLVVLLMVLRLAGVRGRWWGGLALFAATSSALILAGYLLSAKYTWFEKPVDDLPDPTNGWGGYVMLGAALVAAGAMWWSSPARDAGPGRRSLLGDLLVVVGTALAFAGSLRPFLSLPTMQDLWSPLRPEPVGVDFWGRYTFTAPLTWSILAAVVLTAVIALWRRLRPSSTLAWSQLFVAAYAVVVVVGYAASDKYLIFGFDPAGRWGPMAPHGGDVSLENAFGMRFGLGGWLLLAGCLIALAGAVAALLPARRPAEPAPPAPD